MFRKSPNVFEKLLHQSILIKESGKIISKILKDWNSLEKNWKRLYEIENEADSIVHYITEEIERIFILPLDKEDIKTLTEGLDDIIDNLEQLANRLFIYKIRKGNKEMKEFIELLKNAFDNIHEGMLLISQKRIQSEEFIKIIEELHSLENKADFLHRSVLERLMNGKTNFAKKNVLLIMKWKEIFQLLEDTMDKCEDFAIIFSILRIKYA